MSDNTANKFITEAIEDDEIIEENTQNNFPAAIKEIGEAIFERYPLKTSNLSSENVLGMIRCYALNDFMQENYGIRYNILDIVVEQTNTRRLSHKGYGLTKFIEAMQAIQATFEQHEVPSFMRNLLQRGK